MRVLALFLLFLSVSLAKLKVVATYPWIGELVKEIGKDRVSLYVIAKGKDDPHFVVLKPSHIAKMKDADLLKVIQYHKFYDYLLRRYGMVSVGTLEPLPGIPPTGRHIEGLISRAQGVKFILRDVYHEKRTAQFVAHGCDARSQRPFLFV